MTLRERDSCKQVRIEMTEIGNVVHSLASGKKIWEEVTAKYPSFTEQEASK